MVAPHCPASFSCVMSDGQVSSQVCAVTVAVAVNVLSVSNSSAVELETVEVAVTCAPAVAAGSTWKLNCNTAVVLAGRVAIVQTEFPMPPEVGFVQLKAGPES
jgi:hypothetical protein